MADKHIINKDGEYCVKLDFDELSLTLEEGEIEVEPRPDHWFDFVDGAWVENTTRKIEWLTSGALSKRQRLLARVVDPVVSNPLRWADLSTEQQDAWAAYRRALLDITDQAGFPQNIVWPTKPE